LFVLPALRFHSLFVEEEGKEKQEEKEKKVMEEKGSGTGLRGWGTHSHVSRGVQTEIVGKYLLCCPVDSPGGLLNERRGLFRGRGRSISISHRQLNVHVHTLAYCMWAQEMIVAPCFVCVC